MCLEVGHDRPELKINLFFCLYYQKKRIQKALIAFEITFPFQSNTILDINNKEILQVTMLSICLVRFLFYMFSQVSLLCCWVYFDFFFFPNLKAIEQCDVVTKSTLLGNPVEESLLHFCLQQFTFSLLKYHSATFEIETVALAGGSP